MYEGYLMRREHDDNVHLSTLRLLRHIGYINYIAIPTKKKKKQSITKFYPLAKDKEESGISEDVIQAHFKRKEPVITNGKLRGYIDKYGDLYSKDGELVMKNDNRIN